jgi:glycosyltransferase involved in cell wall biosynthesis
MRIATLSSGHPVDDERTTYKYALSLASFGHDVTVIGRSPDNPFRPSHPRLGFDELAPRSRGFLSRLEALHLLYQRGKKVRPDAVVCFGPDAVLVGLLLRHRLGSRVVFDVVECYDGLAEAKLGRYLGRLGALAMRLPLRLLARLSDWVNVVSPVTWEQYSRYRRDGRVSLIHNSSRVEWFPKSDGRIDGALVVLHEGNLDRSRGMLEMLEALAIVRRSTAVRMLLVGRIRREDKALFDDSVRRLDLAGNLDMPAWMPYERIGSVESTAHIGIIALQDSPNARGSLNNKLYNYIACGLPVIAPKGGATESMVQKYRCGRCVDTSSPHEIAAEIIRLGSDGNLRAELGNNGRNAFERELGWHRMEEKLRVMCATLGLQNVRSEVSETNCARSVGAQVRGLPDH